MVHRAEIGTVSTPPGNHHGNRPERRVRKPSETARKPLGNRFGNHAGHREETMESRSYKERFPGFHGAPGAAA
jgi:hypothetical protein